MICKDLRAQDFPADEARSMIDELKTLRPLCLGDYYPLTDINQDERHWFGWQFDRPEIGQGFTMMFRRCQSPYRSIEVALKGIDSIAEYQVTFVDTGEQRRMMGAELERFRFDIAGVPEGALIMYRKAE
jgi:alpha-galactosidase